MTVCDLRRSLPSEPRVTTVIFVRIFPRFFRRLYADFLIRTVTLRLLLAVIVNARRPMSTFLPRRSATVPLHCLPFVGPQDSRTFVRRLLSTRSLLLEMRMR